MDNYSVTDLFRPYQEHDMKMFFNNGQVPFHDSYVLVHLVNIFTLFQNYFLKFFLTTLLLETLAVFHMTNQSYPDSFLFYSELQLV